MTLLIKKQVIKTFFFDSFIMQPAFKYILKNTI